MAAPIIDSVSAPSVVEPGATFDVRITAHDPDSRAGTLAGEVADAQGNVVPVTVSIRVEDPLTFALEDVDGVGYQIVADADVPGLFHVTAP